MKSILLLTFLSILCSFSAYSFTEKTENNPTKELIVAFEKLSSKQFVELETALNNIEGIKHVGQCESMNIYFFSYDSNVYRSAEEAFEALILKTKEFQPILKIGSTIEQVINVCN